MNIYLGLATNYNLQTDILLKEEESDMVSIAYIAMQTIFEDLDIKTNHFPVGWTTEKLNESYPEITNNIKKQINKGRIELGSHTYGHPIIPLILTRDFIKQIEFELEIDKKVYGKSPIGFYPPEWCYDPTIPEVINKFDFSWIMLLNSNVVDSYRLDFSETFKPHYVKGTNNSYSPVSFVYGDKNLEIRTDIFNLFDNKLSPKEFASKFLIRLEKEKGDILDNLFVLLYFDIETPFFAYRENNKNPAKNMYLALEEIFSANNIESVFISEFLEMFPPNKEDKIVPQMFATYKPLNMWKIGSEKLDLLIEEARQKIYLAEDLYPKDPLVLEAWKNLLLAEGADPRIAVSPRRLEGIPLGNKIRYGNFERVIDAYNFAINAKKLAHQILDK